MLQIASPRFALIAAHNLVPFCSKKNSELRTLIEYYEDRITGTEAIAKINEAVRRGVRLGVVRPLTVLPSYNEGKHIVARARGMRAAEVRRERNRILKVAETRPLSIVLGPRDPGSRVYLVYVKDHVGH